jgi:hypothetical protein
VGSSVCIHICEGEVKWLGTCICIHIHMQRVSGVGYTGWKVNVSGIYTHAYVYACG